MSAARTTPLPAEAIAYYEIISNIHTFAPMLMIVDKWKRKVRLNFTRAQRAFISRIKMGERGVTHVVVKPRQIGLTTVMHAVNLHAAVTQPNTRIMTMFDKDENTLPARLIVDRMYESIPDGVDAGLPRGIGKPRLFTDNTVTKQFDNGSTWGLATAGGKTSGRSRTIDIFHGSEVAYWPDPEAIASGALEAAEFALLRVLESTANGAQGWFYDIAQRANDNDPAYRLHFFPWWWASEYSMPLDPDTAFVLTGEEQELVEKHGLTLEQINWRRYKISTKPLTFFQEYPEDISTAFLTSGGGFFGDTSKFFTAPTGATKQDGKRYVGGIDWGQSSDYTVFSIGCVDDGQMVYRYRVNRMEYDDMIEQIVNLVLAWGVDVVIPERNSMSMQVSRLRAALEQRAPACQLQPFTTSNDSKRKGIMALHTALHTGALSLLPDPVARAEYNAFESTQTSTGAYTYQAAGDGHDDCIIADMLMWRAMNAAPIGVY